VLTALAKCGQLASVDPGALVDEALTEWRAVEDEIERTLGLEYLSWVVRWEARYAEAIALADESLTVMRRTGDRRLILRGLVWLAHAHVDAHEVAHTDSVLSEAEALAEGDPTWELAAIRGDCEYEKRDYVAALSWWIESLTWTSTTGESHQMLMDMSCVVLALAGLGDGEMALEAFELLRLERERTGRFGDRPTTQARVEDAVAAARAQIDTGAAQRATARARDVPVTARAAHAIEVAGLALARVTPRE
jgi:hypothetical protein